MALFLLITYIVILIFQIILFVISIRKKTKKALADIFFGRTSSAAYIHRTDDLL